MNSLFTLSAMSLLAFTSAAHAEGCTAQAEAKGIWTVKEGEEYKRGAEYQVKFRVSSDDCKKHDCTGYLLYDSRYILENGRAYRQHRTVDYRINAPERATEVVDDIIPGPTSQKLTVDGVHVKKIYCMTP